MVVMRKVLIITCLTMFYATWSVAQQQSQDNTPDICKHLEQTGRVVLRHDPRLNTLLTTPKTHVSSSQQQADKGRLTGNGFRIRVFAGNKQNVSKTEAYRIQRMLQEQNPDLETYVVFKTPFWRLLAGNFRTTEEANAVLRQLKKQFPSLAGEMFVVGDEIYL